MEQFSTRLKNRLVTFNTATDVVRFSFIVHDSISNLDLSQHSKAFNCRGNSYVCCASKLSNSFINTEEKCRKFLTPSRCLLYTLHLDLPKGRECSLQNVPQNVTYNLDSWCPHIGKIQPGPKFYILILSDFVKDAIDVYNEKQKVLAWILKMSFSKVLLCHLSDMRILSTFIDCFYPDIPDSHIFKDFMHFNFKKWVTKWEEPRILEYVLFYARHYGIVFTRDNFPVDEIIDFCILKRYFWSIVPILNYVDAPKFSNDLFRRYLMKIFWMRQNLISKTLNNANKWMRRERFHKMLQIIWIHIDCRHHSGASEALRLIWCSVPDAYIGFEEIKKAFFGVFSEEEFKNVYDFYAKSVGKFYERVQPRSLQHLCRSIIRKSLREKQIWIPEGLRQTGLPKLLQSFLNLEKGIYHH